MLIMLQIHIPWETTNVFTPRAKRGAVVAITNCIASVSHWFTPYLFVSAMMFATAHQAMQC